MRAMWIAKPRPGRSVSGTGSLITIIKRKKKIFLSRRCVACLASFYHPGGYLALSVLSYKLSGAWAGECPVWMVGAHVLP